MHGISEQEWVDYLNLSFKGTAQERQRQDGHLASCMDCRELYKRILMTQQSLQDAGAEIRGGFPLDDEQLHLSLVKILVRILDKCVGAEMNK